MRHLDEHVDSLQTAILKKLDSRDIGLYCPKTTIPSILIQIAKLNHHPSIMKNALKTSLFGKSL